MINEDIIDLSTSNSGFVKRKQKSIMFHLLECHKFVSVGGDVIYHILDIVYCKGAFSYDVNQFSAILNPSPFHLFRFYHFYNLKYEFVSSEELFFYAIEFRISAFVRIKINVFLCI